MRFVLHAKIHGATVTESNVDYMGSITIDRELVEEAGFWAGEKVLVSSLSSGARLETYILLGKPGSGAICMNGPTAHLINTGEKIVIMGFELSAEAIEAKNIFVDKNNKLSG
jgi:aspartate 1-decarboxylase